MTDEMELVIAALKNIQEDVREIRSTQTDQGKSISDLCTRTALTDNEVQKVISDKVKGETKIYKIMSIAGTAIISVITAITSLKSAGFLH